MAAAPPRRRRAGAGQPEYPWRSLEGLAGAPFPEKIPETRSQDRMTRNGSVSKTDLSRRADSHAPGVRHDSSMNRFMVSARLREAPVFPKPAF